LWFFIFRAWDFFIVFVCSFLVSTGLTTSSSLSYFVITSFIFTLFSTT
jgi:hypothetical protein